MDYKNKYIEVHPNTEIVKMYKEKKQFYHALNLACIESLDCDIPLDIAFKIMNYVNSPDYRYMEHTGGYYYSTGGRGALKLMPTHSYVYHSINRHQKAKTPKHLKSNSGAGYR